MSERQEPCASCLALPRAGGWTSRSDVPAGYWRLVDLDALGHGLAKCPDCSTLYRRGYEEEWDDGSYWEAWSIERLAPTDARDVGGEHGAWWREHCDAEIEAWGERLDHEDTRIREDASWILAKAALAERNWATLRRLLHETDLTASRVAADVAERSGVEIGSEAFGGRGDALPGLVRLRVRAAMREAPSVVLGILALDDAAAVRAAVGELDRWHREDLDVAPYVGRLLELAWHESAEVRQVVGWILSRLTRRDDVVRVTELGRAMLADPRPALREMGCDVLRMAAPVLTAPDAVPLLARLLEDREVHWHANRALQAYGEAGVDLSAVVPVLVGKLVRNPRKTWARDLELLEVVRAAGHDISATSGAVVELVRTAEGQHRALAAQLLEKLLDARVVPAPTVDLVEGLLANLPGYQAERVGRALAGVRIGEEDWAGLERLWAGSTTIAWAAVDALRLAHESRVDVAGALRGLRRVATEASEHLREHARRLLVDVCPRDLQVIRLKAPAGTQVSGYDVDSFVVECDLTLESFDFRLELGRGLSIFWALPAGRNDRLRLILVDGAAFTVDEPVLTEDPFVGDLELQWEGRLARLPDGTEVLAASIRMTGDPASYEFEVQTYWSPRDLGRTDRLAWTASPVS